MKLLLSEARPDYGNYVFPYAVWGFPEPGETPAECFAAGFLPSLPDLSRWYLCRQVRVRLSAFSPSSENRRILRKGAALSCILLERPDFKATPERLDFCHGYAQVRWSYPPARERIERIFASPLTTHVAHFTNLEGKEAGIVTLFRDGATWFYSNAFFAPDAPPGTGAYLMTELVRRLAEAGQGFLHLGTCYSRSALYKTQFAGMEFFDGSRWNADPKALKHLLARQEGAPSGHLLEDSAWQEAWVPEGLEALAQESLLGLNLAAESPRPGKITPGPG